MPGTGSAQDGKVRKSSLYDLPSKAATTTCLNCGTPVGDGDAEPHFTATAEPCRAQGPPRASEAPGAIGAPQAASVSAVPARSATRSRRERDEDTGNLQSSLYALESLQK